MSFSNMLTVEHQAGASADLQLPVHMIKKVREMFHMQEYYADVTQLCDGKIISFTMASAMRSIC